MTEENENSLIESISFDPERYEGAQTFRSRGSEQERKPEKATWTCRLWHRWSKWEYVVCLEVRGKPKILEGERVCLGCNLKESKLMVLG